MKILVVHGNLNEGYELTGDSEVRILRAIEEIHTGKYDFTILTGGLFKKEQAGVYLADALENFIRQRGITKNVKKERKSLTTIHNVELLQDFISPNDIIVVITSDYHKFRTWLIWKLITKRNVKVIGVKSPKTPGKIITELVGIGITLVYAIGIKFPELLFRNVNRKI